MRTDLETQTLLAVSEWGLDAGMTNPDLILLTQGLLDQPIYLT